MPSFFKPTALLIAIVAILAAAPSVYAQDADGPDQSTPWATMQSIIDTQTTSDLVALIHPDDRETLPDDLDMDDPSPAADLKNTVILEVRTDRGWAVVFVQFEPKDGDIDFAPIAMVLDDDRWWMIAPAGQSTLDVPDWVQEQSDAWEEHYSARLDGLDRSSPRALLESAWRLAQMEMGEAANEALHPAIRDDLDTDNMPLEAELEVVWEHNQREWAALVATLTFYDENGDEKDWMPLGLAAALVDGTWYLIPDEFLDAIDGVPDWIAGEIADAKAKAERDHLFPGYEPKLTPDTVFDYRPSLMQMDLEDPETPELGEATLENLPMFLDAVAYWSDRADREKGEWIDGRAWLGMEKEYVPSDAELMESWCGDQCQRVLAENDEEEVAKFLDGIGRGSGASVTYNQITIDHVDAMGSGRFFFASEPTATSFVLPSLHR